MKASLKSLSIWYLPVVLSFLFELFFTDFRGYHIKNLIENTLTISIVLLIFSFFNSSRSSLWIAKIIFVLLALSFCVESLYFYLFNTYFSSSAIFIFLETNANETNEFVSSYFNLVILGYVFIHLIVIVWFCTKKNIFLLDSDKNLKTKCKLLLLSFMTAFLIGSGYYFTNFQYQFISGAVEYIEETKKYEALKISTSVGDFEEVNFKGNSGPHTFVIIIGESTSRNHMGIYDFYRSTTPKLSKIKNDLLIYQDVISSASHTIESLQAAFTLNNFEKQTESTILQLFNQAGFKTFWLSNQNPIGLYDTLLTKIAKASDEFVFTNTTDYGSKTPYDEVLLTHLDQALDSDSENKLIVLHLLATHGRYQLRYPEAYNYFKDIPRTDFKEDSNYEYINTYHNSIAYVDNFVDAVIKKVKAKKNKSYVLYFSDHGEEVFWDRNFFGHNDLEEPTKSMFDIPFLVWLSPEYNEAYSIDFDPTRPYSLEHFIHSISDLSKVDFKEINLSNSIFSSQFRPSKRRISNRFDYDIYFKKE